MNAMVMLADGAHAVNGRLYVLGGGIRTVVAGMPYSVVAKVEVDYLDATASHTYGLTLFDEDGEAVSVDDNPVALSFTGGTGIPGGHPVGMPIDVMFAFTAPQLPLEPGLYEWRLSVDSAAAAGGIVRFSVVQPPPSTL
jgi:hypothetical protein